MRNTITQFIYWGVGQVSVVEFSFSYKVVHWFIFFKGQVLLGILVAAVCVCQPNHQVGRRHWSEGIICARDSSLGPFWGMPPGVCDLLRYRSTEWSCWLHGRNTGIKRLRVLPRGSRTKKWSLLEWTRWIEPEVEVSAPKLKLDLGNPV